MSGSRNIGATIILVAAVLLVIVAAGFVIGVLRSDLGGFIVVMSLLALAAAVVALVASLSVFRRTRSAG